MQIETEHMTANERMSATIPVDGKTHLAYLDGLRAVAALYVVCSHIRGQVYNNNHPLHGFLAVLNELFSFGHYAVSTFIVLSGFCLMLPVIRSGETLKLDAVRFLQKRARRIVPTYYFAVAFSLLLIYTLIGHATGTHWDISLPVSKKAIITHILLVQDIFPGSAYKINHALWSISVEWRIYFLFPLLVMGWRKFGAIKTTIATTIMSYALVVFVAHRGYNWSIQYIACFAVGMLAAGIAYSDIPALSRYRKSNYAFVIVPALAIWFLLDIRGLRYQPFADIFFAIFVLGLFVLASRPLPNPVGSMFGAKWLSTIGTFSYSIYLIHAPLLQLLQQYAFKFAAGSPIQMLVMLTFLGLPLIVGISYAFHLVCERPFMNTKPRREIALASS